MDLFYKGFSTLHILKILFLRQNSELAPVCSSIHPNLYLLWKKHQTESISNLIVQIRFLTQSTIAWILHKENFNQQRHDTLCVCIVNTHLPHHCLFQSTWTKLPRIYALATHQLFNEDYHVPPSMKVISTTHWTQPSTQNRIKTLTLARNPFTWASAERRPMGKNTRSENRIWSKS